MSPEYLDSRTKPKIERAREAFERLIDIHALFYDIIYYTLNVSP